MEGAKSTTKPGQILHLIARLTWNLVLTCSLFTTEYYFLSEVTYYLVPTLILQNITEQGQINI